MAAPNRPTSGAPIESTWGDAVHDASVATLGVVVACAVYASNTARVALDINSVVQGKASMADLAGDAIVIPVTGIYEVIVSYTCAGVANPGYYRLDLSVAGVSQGAAIPAFASVNSGLLRAGPSATVRKFNAGDRLAIGALAPIGTGTQSITVDWFGVRLVATDWAP